MKFIYFDVKEKPLVSDSVIFVAGYNFKLIATIQALDIIEADAILLETKNISVAKTPTVHCKLDI
jgi:hypothetical protein